MNPPRKLPPLLLPCRVALLVLLMCAPGLLVPASDVFDRNTESTKPPVYLTFEGNMNKIGPQMEYVRQVFGPLDPKSSHLYAFGTSGINLLTRSTAFLKAQVEAAFDAAEKQDVPVMFHIDPLYGWEAGTESSPADAPATKYWNEPDMREWAEFPTGGILPTRIPRPWFNWGCWDSPAPAVPALGSPKFLDFVTKQMTEGLAQPIAARVAQLESRGQGYLFAGINIGWETSMFRYHEDLKKLPVALLPVQVRGLRMQPWEANAQLGYASLYWRGWDQKKLDTEAARRNISSHALFNELIYHVLHDYNETLTKTLVDQGVSRDKIYTHIVAMSTVNPARTSSTCPPIWVAVNRYSVPGFTMDARGAAVYNLSALRQQIRGADPTQEHFAAIESYLAHDRQDKQLRDTLQEIYGNGGVMKVLFGVFGKGTPFELRPSPDPATLVIADWLKAGLPPGN